MTGLIILIVLNGLVPSVQIQLTSAIIGGVAQAVRAGRPQNLVNIALLFGVLQGALLLFTTLLGLATQQVQSLLMLRLDNRINILVMEKANSLDVQCYEDHESYDKLQRTSNGSMFLPTQIFLQMSTLGAQMVTLISVVAVLFSWNWWLGLLILLAPLPSAGSQFFYSRSSYLIERERAPL